MQRLFNVNKWAVLEAGSGLAFNARRPRVVRVDVNAPGEACLYIQQAADPDDLAFLARVVGRDTLEFYVSGPFTLSVEDGSCSIFTVDGEDISRRAIDPVIFTKIANRRKRSPELEYIAHKMAENLERRLAAQAGELRAYFEGREAARAAQSRAPILSRDAGSQPEQGPEDGKPEGPDAGDGDAAPRARKGRAKDVGRRDDEE